MFKKATMETYRTSTMSEPALEEILKTRFGHHRGIPENGYIPNSFNAIKDAVDTHPPFVEFDVSLVGKILKTGHPPQEPLDELSDVLGLFENKKTYPKIDIKPLTTSSTIHAIDKTLRIVKQKQITFALLNIGRGHLGRKEFIEIDKYITSKIQNDPAIQLNIDIARYRPYGAPIDKKFKQHIKKIGVALFSISPEIHEEHAETMLQLAQDYKITTVAFWLKSWPDVSNPQVKEKTIRNILALGKKYPTISILFDINAAHVIPTRKSPLL